MTMMSAPEIELRSSCAAVGLAAVAIRVPGLLWQNAIAMLRFARRTNKKKPVSSGISDLDSYLAHPTLLLTSTQQTGRPYRNVGFTLFDHPRTRPPTTELPAWAIEQNWLLAPAYGLS
jgi:hypothetical protein